MRRNVFGLSCLITNKNLSWVCDCELYCEMLSGPTFHFKHRQTPYILFLSELKGNMILKSL